MSESKVNIQLSAIDPFVVDNIPESTEIESDTIYINEDAAEEYLINSGVSSSTLASLE